MNHLWYEYRLEFTLGSTYHICSLLTGIFPAPKKNPSWPETTTTDSIGHSPRCKDVYFSFLWPTFVSWSLYCAGVAYVLILKQCFLWYCGSVAYQLSRSFLLDSPSISIVSAGTLTSTCYRWTGIRSPDWSSAVHLWTTSSSTTSCTYFYLHSKADQCKFVRGVTCAYIGIACSFWVSAAVSFSKLRVWKKTPQLMSLFQPLSSPSADTRFYTLVRYK